MSPDYIIQPVNDPRKYDTWIVGVTFYRLLSGHWPFQKAYENWLKQGNKGDFAHFMPSISKKNVADVLRLEAPNLFSESKLEPSMIMIEMLLSLDAKKRPTPGEYVSQYGIKT
jgi:serine/threonine protein kinase